MNIKQGDLFIYWKNDTCGFDILEYKYYFKDKNATNLIFSQHNKSTMTFFSVDEFKKMLEAFSYDKYPMVSKIEMNKEISIN